LVIGPPFSSIGLSKTDDSNPIIGFQVTESVEAITQISERDPSVLSILLSLIKPGQGSFKFKVSGTLEGNTSEFDVPLVLGGVENDLHPGSVYTKKFNARPFLDSTPLLGLRQGGGLTNQLTGHAAGGGPVGMRGLE
jgi:hypothetical protein